MGCPWDAYGTLAEISYGMPMGRLWDAHGMSIYEMCPWEPQGMPMGCLRDVPMGTPRDAYGMPVRCSWERGWMGRRVSGWASGLVGG